MIKEWFLEKNFTSNERYIIDMAQINEELEVVGESEKAIKFKANSDFGSLEFWCPKSCVYTEEEVKEKIEKREQALVSGLDYNEKLLNVAKENGIKGVRKGMKTVTLQRKIEEAGIEIPKR